MTLVDEMERLGIRHEPGKRWLVVDFGVYGLAEPEGDDGWMHLSVYVSDAPGYGGEQNAACIARASWVGIPCGHGVVADHRYANENYITCTSVHDHKKKCRMGAIIELPQEAVDAGSFYLHLSVSSSNGPYVGESILCSMHMTEEKPCGAVTAWTFCEDGGPYTMLQIFREGTSDMWDFVRYGTCRKAGGESDDWQKLLIADNLDMLADDSDGYVMGPDGFIGVDAIYKSGMDIMGCTFDKCCTV